MEPYKIVIAALLVSQLFTLFALREAIKRADGWHAEWAKVSKERLDCIIALKQRSGTTSGNYVNKVTPS
jgi:hypothetical protein